MIKTLTKEVSIVEAEGNEKTLDLCYRFGTAEMSRRGQKKSSRSECKE